MESPRRETVPPPGQQEALRTMDGWMEEGRKGRWIERREVDGNERLIEREERWIEKERGEVVGERE